jgi:hypothetical protein
VIIGKDPDLRLAIAYLAGEIIEPSGNGMLHTRDLTVSEQERATATIAKMLRWEVISLELLYALADGFDPQSDSDTRLVVKRRRRGTRRDRARDFEILTEVAKRVRFQGETLETAFFTVGPMFGIGTDGVKDVWSRNPILRRAVMGKS